MGEGRGEGPASLILIANWNKDKSADQERGCPKRCLDQLFLRFLGGSGAERSSRSSHDILPSIISIMAISPAPKPAVSEINGRPPDPPLVSWRTRRDMILTRTLGFPTFSRAFLQNSLFNGASRYCFILYGDDKLLAAPIKATEKFGSALILMVGAPLPRRTTVQQHRRHQIKRDRICIRSLDLTTELPAFIAGDKISLPRRSEP
jgi:hypothetical protein